MPKTQAAPQTVTWIPTRADTIEVDGDGNVLAVNGELVASSVRPSAPQPKPAPDPGDA